MIISKIKRLSDEEFKDLVMSSGSIKDVIKRLGYKGGGSIHKSVKERIIKLNIDLTHMDEAIRQKRIDCSSGEGFSHSDVFIENSNYNRSSLKKRILKYNLIEYKCSECNSLPTWNGEELVLILDHINGVNNDNRIENLRFLCPNCNSQTSTFAGRNVKFVKEIKICSMCGNTISSRNKSGLCFKCITSSRRRVVRPDIDTLNAQILELGFLGAGRLYGVSDNAIRKWIKNDNTIF